MWERLDPPAKGSKIPEFNYVEALALVHVEELWT
jgi:hypothetical protein